MSVWYAPYLGGKALPSEFDEKLRSIDPRLAMNRDRHELAAQRQEGAIALFLRQFAGFMRRFGPA